MVSGEKSRDELRRGATRESQRRVEKWEEVNTLEPRWEEMKNLRAVENICEKN